ncbi:MAG: polysaccharide deacetylase family protein [Firmicutes bacterium]|nr:polysaccharide deacetylase family protein [Bacillota bacterium]
MRKRTLFLAGSASRIKRIMFVLAIIILLIFAAKLIVSAYHTKMTSVEKGVVFWEKNVGKWSRDDVEKYVKKIAAREIRQPIDAEIDLANKMIVPEVSGMRIDVDATVEKIMDAEPHEKVLPLYRQINARIKWDDYPALPASRGNPNEKCVSLMINVAWGEEYLSELLSVLRDENVKATFFITGKWAEKNQKWVQKIAGDGHELGSHGYSDAEVMTDLNNDEIEKSLLATNEILYEASGKEPKYFTPHKGEYNQLVLEIVARNSMRTVLWSLDTVDWRDQIEKMESSIKENVKGGDIILMHPTRDISELLTRILPFMKEEGLHVVTVDEHLSSFPFFDGP